MKTSQRVAHRSLCRRRDSLAERAPEIEALEDRIAPSAVFSYTDVDGDRVTIKTSKGAQSDLEAAGILTFSDPVAANPRQLQKIDFSANATAFAGTDLAVTVKLAGHGDGFANVGYVDATAADGGTALGLGKVSIRGDLAKISAGTGAPATLAVKSLAAQSLGRLGISTGAPDLHSVIGGSLGALTLLGDLDQAWLDVAGGIGKINVGGSIVGGGDAKSGAIICTGPIGMVKIGGDIIGGSAAQTGAISTLSTLKSAVVGGSLIGGTFAAPDFGNGTGGIGSVGDMGTVKVLHDVRGGSGHYSGAIVSLAGLKSVSVGGSVLGNAGSYSGWISSFTGTASVKVGHNVTGGAGDNSALITSGGFMGGITIGGSVLGGAKENAGLIHSVGDMGAVKIAGDVRGGDGDDSGRVYCRAFLKSIAVTGSMIGGLGEASGAIFAEGSLGVAKVGGDIVGGIGDYSGEVGSAGSVTSVLIHGSIFGGAGDYSGSVSSVGNIGAVKIGHDIVGGTATYAGAIGATGPMGNLLAVSVGGSIVGGTMDYAGTIGVTGSIGVVKIGHNIVGGASKYAGAIGAQHSIGSVELGGSLYGGAVQAAGAIGAGDEIGTIKIGGSVVGSVTAAAIIGARGQLAPTPTTDLAIKSITIKGRVERAIIGAGWETSLAPLNGNAQIGSVKVGGDWIASTLTAGVMNLGADDLPGGVGLNADNVNFGDVHDVGVAGGSIARIAKIVIGGQVQGTVAASDHFGFLSRQIDAISIGGAKIALTAGKDNLGISATSDVNIHEVT